MSSEGAGTLYLLPNTLGEAAPEDTIPAPALARACSLRYFIAENPKAARAFLKRIGYPRPIQQARIERLDHNTPAEEIAPLLEPIVAGEDCGLVSEAGLPAVADPGSGLVGLAHERGVRVVPLAGPSSLMLALCASGLEGQRFAFHGYLPVAEEPLSAALKELEQASRRLRQTQLFIETPYRNQRTFAAMLRALSPETLVCVATDLTLAGETIRTSRVAAWRRAPALPLNGRPTVFLVLAG